MPRKEREVREEGMLRIKMEMVMNRHAVRYNKTSNSAMELECPCLKQYGV